MAPTAPAEDAISPQRAAADDKTGQGQASGMVSPSESGAIAPSDIATATAGPPDEPAPRKEVASTILPSDLEQLVGQPSEGDDSVGADMVEPLVDVQAAVLAAPKDAQAEQVEAVAAGTMLDGLLSQALEFEENGWSQTGAPTVVSAEIAELNADGAPPTAELRVCLDHSGVALVDAAGESIKDPAAPVRVSTIYELEFRNARWIAVYQTFEDNTDC